MSSDVFYVLLEPIHSVSGVLSRDCVVGVTDDPKIAEGFVSLGAGRRFEISMRIDRDQLERLEKQLRAGLRE